MDGKSIIGMVLTQGSVAVCLEETGGTTYMGNNRSGFDTRRRYAVTAPLRGACTFRMFHTGGALMGGCLTFPRFRLHGREWIIGIVLARCSATRCWHFWEKWV